MAIAVRIDKDLEVGIVVKNVGIVLFQGRPDMRLLELSADIEALIVPEHFDPCPIGRLGLIDALDIREIRSPGYSEPSRVIELAVELDRRRRPIGDIFARRYIRAPNSLLARQDPPAMPRGRPWFRELGKAPGSLAPASKAPVRWVNGFTFFFIRLACNKTRYYSVPADALLDIPRKQS